jgi:hypothetical protein
MAGKKPVYSIDDKLDCISLDDIRTFFKDAIGTAFVMAASPYIIPTCARWMNENDELSMLYGQEKLSPAENAGTGTGVYLGLAIDIAQFIGYGFAVGNNMLEVLLFPVATNVLSGIYEAGKYIKEKKEEREFEKRCQRDMTQRNYRGGGPITGS